MAANDIYLSALPSESTINNQLNTSPNTYSPESLPPGFYDHSRTLPVITVSENESMVHVSTSELVPQKKQKQERNRIAEYYKGGTGLKLFPFVKYQRPVASRGPSSINIDEEDKELEYLDRFGNKVYKNVDVPVYLSKTRYTPRRLFVQCTDHVWNSKNPQGGDWRRVRMKGSVPLVLKMAEFALRPARKRGEDDQRGRSILGILEACGRTMLVGPWLQALMLLPGMEAPWEDNTDTDDKYDDYPGYTWDWPVHAVDRFDMGTNRITPQTVEYSAKPRMIHPKKLVVFDESTEMWTIDTKPDPTIPFVVISFTRVHFPVSESALYKTTKEKAEKARYDLEELAKYVTKRYFMSGKGGKGGASEGSQTKYAFWLDYLCGCSVSERKAEGDAFFDQYTDTICDVIRTAKKVIIALPHDPSHELKDYNYLAWGESLWTLAEVLLANGDIQICWPFLQSPSNVGTIEETPNQNVGVEFNDSNIKYMVHSLTKIEMAGTFWDDHTPGMVRRTKLTEDQQPTRILAEHFSGLLNLSRIELFITALAAFQNRFPAGRKPKEFKAALMAILNHRVDNITEEESLFHSMARLNMANDNDDFIERMICWAPTNTCTKVPDHLSTSIFSSYNLSYPDQYGLRLWNIHPMCSVVGLAKEDNTIMIDGCRAISIRWKNFPTIQYKRSRGTKKRLAELIVRSGGLWMVAAFGQAITYLPFFVSDPRPDVDDLGGTDNARRSTDPQSTTSNSSKPINGEMVAVWVVFICLFIATIGIILSLFGPVCVARLYGGSITESSSRLVAFEGTLPEDEIEKLIFGTIKKRLQWQPSSSPLSNAESDKRMGKRPTWFQPGSKNLDEGEMQRKRQELNIPSSHKIFTLVDTGRLTISTFSAKHPPTAALLCGRDGGMLRAVLCSWDFRNDCLYKECVIRMSTDVWEDAIPKSWLKLCLHKRRTFNEE